MLQPHLMDAPGSRRTQESLAEWDASFTEFYQRVHTLPSSHSLPPTWGDGWVCERSARTVMITLHESAPANPARHHIDGRLLHSYGDGTGGVRAAASAADRPPARQAHVRFPQGLKRLQVSDGRGV